MATKDKLTVLDVIFRPEDERTYSYISDEEGYEVGDIQRCSATDDDTIIRT